MPRIRAAAGPQTILVPRQTGREHRIAETCSLLLQQPCAGRLLRRTATRSHRLHRIDARARVYADRTAFVKVTRNWYNPHSAILGSDEKRTKGVKIVVEGWRSLSHSYAIVNQWQLLALAARPEIELRARDLPFYRQTWQAQPGLFPPQSAGIIAALKTASPDFVPDATWRVAFPYDLTPAPTGRTLVYGTSEYRIVPDSYLAANGSLARALADPRVTITTPSHWSAEGFRRLGFADDRVAVVPHGIDPSLFRPRPDWRARVRAELGLSGFVFMSAGAMTGNKGMDLLLRAFATVAARHRDVRLLLKGADALYSSKQFLGQAATSLSQAEIDLIAERLVYRGAALSMDQMSLLYQAADAYVSPYRAEGFNLPVLEAAACGVPVICTRGGPTDDFVTDDFALRIDSRLVPTTFDGATGTRLEPDADHLTALMLRVLDDTRFHASAILSGPRHAAGHFTWAHAVEKTIPLLSG
jgi:glycosyltransferase involved in cell wall biosynthesis